MAPLFVGYGIVTKLSAVPVDVSAFDPRSPAHVAGRKHVTVLFGKEVDLRVESFDGFEVGQTVKMTLELVTS